MTNSLTSAPPDEPPERRPSNAIRSFSWDDRTRVLTVTFVSGETYVYREVPGAVYEAFLAAESWGRFFQAEIRGRYAFERVEGPLEPRRG